MTLSSEPPPAPPPRTGPPIVVYSPHAYPAPPPPRYIYRPRVLKPKAEWGLNLHGEGAFFGSAGAGGGAMGGGGVGLRFRPVPMYALQADVDFYGGRDYYDYQRTETSFMLNSFIFLNPKSKVQFYLLAGFGWSVAHVSDVPFDDGTISGVSNRSYAYFGAQGGAGLEARLSPHVALNADFRGFIRGRIDDDTRTEPEFISSDGRVTNTSAGVVGTGGITFYF